MLLSEGQPSVSRNASYFLRLGCFRHFPSTVPQMHLWTRDRHLCDGLSHRHRWTCARHGIAVDESSEIIVVQLQLCAVARHAAKLPVPGWNQPHAIEPTRPHGEFLPIFACSEMVFLIVARTGRYFRVSETA